MLDAFRRKSRDMNPNLRSLFKKNNNKKKKLAVFFLIKLLCSINGEMCLIVNFSLIFFYIYYSTVNENSTNNVPVVFFFFLHLYLDVEGKLFIWPNCLPAMNESCFAFCDWVRSSDSVILRLFFYSTLVRWPSPPTGSLSSRRCEWAVAQ